MAKRTPPAVRFWVKVDKRGPIPKHRPELGPCWMWTGAKAGTGYGSFRVGGRESNAVPAHRFAIQLLVGPVPEGLEPDHLCRVRSCVKAIADEHGPAHLELVTQRENILRGTGMSARHARKTYCPKGHPYDAANTHRTKLGRRHCRRCHRERERERRARLHPDRLPGRSH